MQTARKFTWCHLLKSLLACAHDFQHRWRASGLRAVVASRIVVRLRNTHRLDLAVNNVQRVALAAVPQPLALRAGVVELHTQRFGQRRCRVTHERQQRGVVDLLVRRPSLHYRAIIDAVHQHFVNTRVLEFVLFLEVSRDLRGGSRGRERTGQAQQDDLLAGATLRQVDLLRREPKVEGDIGGNAVANGYNTGHDYTARSRTLNKTHEPLSHTSTSAIQKA